MSSTRSYVSPKREAEAAKTRTQIVDAAALLFARDGYAATPMKSIAAEAGVSIQSVNLAGPKSSLLLAAFERTFAGDEGRHSLTERPEMQEILAESDPRVALAKYAAYLTAANSRSAGIWGALNAAADADELVREAAADLEGRRRRDMGLGVAALVERGLVAPGSVGAASDVLGLLTSPTTFLYFTRECGWPLDQYEAWLVRSVASLVLD